MSRCILAIDQGTTGTTCLVVEMDGTSPGILIRGRGYAELRQNFPRPGWVEHDLEDIWGSVLRALQQALDRAQLSQQDLAGIGITNQRETACVWDERGKPAYNAIVWQDRRTAEACESLTQGGYGALIQQRTGLVIDPYFSGTKWGWLLANVPGLRAQAAAGTLRLGTVDSWLVWRLTAGKRHITDISNAARTQLFDIHKHAWDPELCALCGDVPQASLPQVRGNSEVYGHTLGVPGLADGIPIAGMAGDQQAALFGQACLEVGMAKCTYGTGAFALVNTGTRAQRSRHNLLTTVAWRLHDEVIYALEGSVFVAGAVVQWLRDGLGFFGGSDEVEALAAQVPDSGGVILVPALTGLGAPHWRPHARGLMCGMTRGTTKAHVARAALEGIAFQVHDLLLAMRQDSGTSLTDFRVDGGASVNNLLMQFQADLLGLSTHRPRHVESTALGAAFLASLGVGLYSSVQDVARAWELERTFKPQATRHDIGERLATWRAAVAQA